MRPSQPCLLPVVAALQAVAQLCTCSPLSPPLTPLVTSASIPILLGAGRCWKVLACSAVFALQALCREQQDEETAIRTHCVSHDLLFFQAVVLSPGSHPLTR